MPRPFSRNQIDRLGERLAQGGDLSPADRAMVEELLEYYDQALSQALAFVQSVCQLQPTGRVKTLDTMRDKLRRGTTLSSMQDVAGMRIVLAPSHGRELQTQLAQRIARAFADAKVMDRRDEPTHGYRAVHVIINVVGCPMEVQVRTCLQDLWAQVVERVGDVWGRGIRYGSGPDDPLAPVGDDGLTRTSIIDAFLRLSDIIDTCERGQEEVAVIEATFSDADLDNLDAEEERRLVQLDEGRAVLAHIVPEIRSMLESASAQLGASPGSSEPHSQVE